MDWQFHAGFYPFNAYHRRLDKRKKSTSEVIDKYDAIILPAHKTIVGFPLYL